VIAMSIRCLVALHAPQNVAREPSDRACPGITGPRSGRGQ
jgi:hypothetical protein